MMRVYAYLAFAALSVRCFFSTHAEFDVIQTHMTRSLTTQLQHNLSHVCLPMHLFN